MNNIHVKTRTDGSCGAHSLAASAAVIFASGVFTEQIITQRQNDTILGRIAHQYAYQGRDLAADLSTIYGHIQNGGPINGTFIEYDSAYWHFSTAFLRACCEHPGAESIAHEKGLNFYSHNQDRQDGTLLRTHLKNVIAQNAFGCSYWLTAADLFVVFELLHQYDGADLKWHIKQHLIDSQSDEIFDVQLCHEMNETHWELDLHPRLLEAPSSVASVRARLEPLMTENPLDPAQEGHLLPQAPLADGYAQNEMLIDGLTQLATRLEQLNQRIENSWFLKPLLRAQALQIAKNEIDTLRSDIEAFLINFPSYSIEFLKKNPRYIASFEALGKFSEANKNAPKSSGIQAFFENIFCFFYNKIFHYQALDQDTLTDTKMRLSFFQQIQAEAPSAIVVPAG